MKRWILYIATVALLSTTSFRGTDIAKLAPVEVVWLAEEDGQVLLMTDTEDVGRGAYVQEALAAMKDAALGTVFLDTADYLIVETGAETFLDQIAAVLRPSCMVCRAKQVPDLKKASQFLSAHEPDVTLRQWQNDGGRLPLLQEEERSFVWDEP
jgi:hypothetical protein